MIEKRILRRSTGGSSPAKACVRAVAINRACWRNRNSLKAGLQRRVRVGFDTLGLESYSMQQHILSK